MSSYGDYPDLSRVRSVLVIKLRQLGDVLLATPLFSVLKKKLPQAAIDAYVYSEAIPLLAEHPAVHKVWGYNRDWKRAFLGSRWMREAAMLWALRREGYDLVLNLTEGDRGAIAGRISGAPIRVGFNKGKQRLYTHVAKDCPSLRHKVERNLDLVRRIGIFPAPEDRELVFPLSSAVIEAMRGVAGEGFYLVHPASRWKFKCWPIEKMRQTIRAIRERGFRVVVTSSSDPAERAMAREICAGLDVLNLAGETNLHELGALIYLSQHLLCVDSLPLHIASALKKPVTVLFGPTSEITWGPWRNPHARVVTQPFSCRPCYQDGCGGSKVSECLQTLSVERLEAELFAEVTRPRLPVGQQFIDSPR
jgi:heptosyltransferase-3